MCDRTHREAFKPRFPACKSDDGVCCAGFTAVSPSRMFLCDELIILWRVCVCVCVFQLNLLAPDRDCLDSVILSARSSLDFK